MCSTQHAGLSLRLAHILHSLAAGPLLQAGLRPLILAVALLVADQVGAVVFGDVLDDGHEVLGDGAITADEARGCCECSSWVSPGGAFTCPL